jgi:hypothetical protein
MNPWRAPSLAHGDHTARTWAPREADALLHSPEAVARSRPTASEPSRDLVWGILRASEGRLRQITRRQAGLGEALRVCATASRAAGGRP